MTPARARTTQAARSALPGTVGSQSPPSTPLAGSGAQGCYKPQISAAPDPCAPSSPGPECSDCDRRRDDLPVLVGDPSKAGALVLGGGRSRTSYTLVAGKALAAVGRIGSAA